MSEELKQQFEKLYDELPPFGDRAIDARVKAFTIQFALSCAAQACEQREKERDDCVMLLKAVIAKKDDLQCLREKIVDYLQRKGLTSVLR